MARRQRTSVEVLNLQDSLEAFNDVKRAFGATPLKPCLMEIAKRIRDEARRLAPVGKGLDTKGRKREHLRDLVFASPGKQTLPTVIVGVDRKKAPHAHLIEFGHIHADHNKRGIKQTQAYPFLRPALAVVRRSAKGILGKEINTRIINKLKNRQNAPRVFSGVTDVTDLVEKYGPGVPVKPGEMVSP